MLKPRWCFLGVLLSMCSAFAYFWLFPQHAGDHFFITIYLLIGYYTVIAVVSDRQIYIKKSFARCLPKALGKYLFWGLLLLCASGLYNNHSFYRDNFPGTIKFFDNYLSLFLYLGLPYFILAEKFRSSAFNYYHDPYLRFLSLVKHALKGNLSLVGHRIIRGYYRQFFVSLVLRAHYLAIMVDQIYLYHGRTLENLQQARLGMADITVLIALLTSLAWSIDANNASMGYFWESDFTKTRFRGIDPYPIHWLVTLVCYHPFNLFAYTFIPYAATPADQSLLLDGAALRLTVDILGVVFLAGYIYAGSSLNFSCSNLSYKKIQTGGLYSIVRHPATFFKMGFLFLAVFKFRASWIPITLSAYVIWTTIYVLRTLCEERYLKRFEDYRAYMQKVPYRIIPGIF